MQTPGFWQRRTWKSLALLPMSWLYRAGVWVDRETATVREALVPVVSVGNATVGGTGKTPVTLALVPFLQAMGFNPHILTRGYKADKVLTAHRVVKSDTAAMVGDESLLLAQTAPTWVGRVRYISSQAAVQAGATLVICDDALQHYALKKNLSLMVVDGPYGFGNGRLLPAGPLREPLSWAFARTDAVIWIGDDPKELIPGIGCPVFQAYLAPVVPAEGFVAEQYFAFAGIGRPEKFFTTLRDAGVRLAGTRAFADHYHYSVQDIEKLIEEASALGAQLITTEKDAVKIPLLLRDKVAVLPVSLQFEAPELFRDFLRARLT